MKKVNKIFSYMLSIIIMCVIALSLGQAVNAQVVTFAQFLEKTGGQDFVFTKNAATNGDFSTIAGGSPIDFRYQNIVNLPAELSGFQDAHLTVTANTTTAANSSGGSLNQPLDSVTTISIIRDTAASVGTGTRRNLLTIIFSTAATTPGFSGTASGNSATLSAATPNNNVTFTSDFLGFALTTQRAAALSFSSVVASYDAIASEVLNSFTAAGTGTFSSDPPPIYSVPTAALATVGGRVTNMFGRGISRAVVQMADANGDIRHARTNQFGYFRFDDVEVGDAYTFNVRAKGYSFSSQVVSVGDNISNLNFVPNFF